MRTHVHILLAVGLMGLQSLLATPIISEFMASNRSSLMDEEGSHPDWIEIHNPDATPIDLAGWHLTDDPALLSKWTFPSTSLPAGGYLVVFASDKNRAVSGSELHTNFKLSADGEYLALVQPDGSTRTSEFNPFPSQLTDVSYGIVQGSHVIDAAVEIGDSLRFHVPTGAVPGWTDNNFDDTSWTAGTTGIGYDTSAGYNSYIASNIKSFCYNINPSVYLRIPFTVNDPAKVTTLELQMKYDDGFAAYLNGQFLASGNAPTILMWNSKANRSIEANLNSYETWNISNQIPLLVAGRNTLAIQMLNQASASSDFLLLPRLVLTREIESTETYDFFTQPTPGAINNTPPGEPSGAVIVSVPSGVKTTALNVTLSPPAPDADIRYTLNGSNPNETSMLYTAPLSLSEPSQLRTRAFEPGKLAGPIAMADYAFIDASLLNYLSDVPIIVMDNFGAGAYPNKGRSNDGHDVMQVERQSNVMAIFEPADNSLPFSQTAALESRAGCRVRGSSSATFPRKPLSVEFWDENDAERDLSPFGMQPEADWVLYAPNPDYDRSLVHNPVAFGFGELIGALTPKFKVVAVFQNTDGGKITASDMEGVYVFMEKVERGRMGLDFDKMDDTGTAGGWMINVDRMEAIPVGMPADTIQPNFHCAGPDGILSIPDDEQNSGGSQSVDDISEFYHSYLNFSSPNGYGILPAQRAEIQSATRAMDAAVWANDYAAHLDSESWARYYATHNFAKNNDMIVLSTYLYRETPTAKIKMGPIWDVDRAFTQNGSAISSSLYNSNRDWFRGLFADIDFKQVHQDIWQEARSTTATDDAIAALVDDAVAGLRPDQIVASGLSYSDWQSRVAAMRTWVLTRAAYLDSQYEALPTVSPATGLFSGSVQVTMAATAGGTVYFTTDGSDPRAPGGSIAASATAYSGPFTVNERTRIMARTKDGSRWSGKIERNVYQLSDIPQLVVSEIAYHPAGPSPTELLLGHENSYDFEYIEIQNIGTTPADLTPLALAGGCVFNFSDGSIASLAPDAMVLVVQNVAAFNARYGSGHPIAGTFAGTLHNASDQIILKDALLNLDLQNFSYEDTAPWPETADGLGYSLVLRQPETNPDHSLAASWRASTTAEGSPGAADPAAPADSGVRINEVLTHTDLPQVDTIELYNTSAFTADLSGWFLTDRFSVPKMFRIPDGTFLLPDGYLIFDETDFDFRLSSIGEEVWLFSANTQSNLTGQVHGFTFGAAQNGVSFGRYVTTVGEEHFPAQSALSLGAANIGPQVGPVVISEIMVHPAPLHNEYIELTNFSDVSVPLFNPTVPASTWRLRNAVAFDFPQGITLPPGGRILLVGFDPLDPAALATFRADYHLSADVPIYGPWTGSLNHTNVTLKLKRPDSPNLDTVPYILVEEVSYQVSEPWPTTANGTGQSLQRIAENRYGNDPDNWYAAAPRPSVAADLSIDSDNDTMTDWQEWKARTDPLDPASNLSLDPPTPQPSGQLEIKLFTVPGRRYALDGTTNLVTQPFYPILENIYAMEDVTLITLSNATDQARFYRLRLDP